MNHTHTNLQQRSNPPEHGETTPIDPPFQYSTNPMDSIILYDDGDWSKGHYEGIFGLYAKACLQIGLRVSAVCPNPELIENQIHAPAGQCRLHRVEGWELKSKTGRLKPLTRLAWWARAGQTIRRIQRLDGHSGPVFFMNINHLRGALWTDRFADRLMPFPWAAFIYDSSSVRGRTVDLKHLQKQFNVLRAKQCRAFGVTDEKMTAPMQEAFPNIGIAFLPDATLEEIGSCPLAEDIVRQADGRKIVGLLGMLHKRKGLLPALKLAKARSDLFFLFAGAIDMDKMTADEKQFVTGLIDSPPDNCFFHLQRIKEEAEFNALMQAVDVVLAVYPHFANSSGLLTKAGLLGKPILVAEGDTCMADRVAKYNIGLAAPFDNIAACSAAIDRLPAVGSRNHKGFRIDFGEEALQAALNKMLKSFCP